MQQNKQPQAKKGGKSGLGIDNKKDGNFAKWYQEVVTKSEMIDYYAISGCYILRPWSYTIWENIKEFIDTDIKKTGVQNAYFPLFVPESALIKEKDHIEGFAPEVAWVTKSGKSDLAKPIAVRPTSETIMYPHYKEWIRSHRDLPLKLNQWNNIVRWEFKSATPFIRSREFLWQEGHSAFAERAEADKEVYYILDLYRRTYEDLLAVPVIPGVKTEKEKFPGGLFTTTVEGFIPTVGRGIQGATSHGLGQNFAKMFDIEYEDKNAKKQRVWQNSWGFTTRSIGVMVMIHGDDKGLVLPPRVAPYQFVLVPILHKTGKNEEVVSRARVLGELLKSQGIRGIVDDRDNYNPGWKYNHWEVKGVPIRLDFGNKDLDQGTIVIVRRDNGEKRPVKQQNIVQEVQDTLKTIHNSMLKRARDLMESRTKIADNFDEFMAALDSKCIAKVAFCDTTKCEEDIKAKSATAGASEQLGALKSEHTAVGNKLRAAKSADPKDNDLIAKLVTRIKELKNEIKEVELEEAEEQKLAKEGFEKLSGSAKSLCKPIKQDPLPEGMKCFMCGAKATTWCLFGRSY